MQAFGLRVAAWPAPGAFAGLRSLTLDSGRRDFLGDVGIPRALFLVQMVATSDKPIAPNLQQFWFGFATGLVFLQAKRRVIP
jgi:hypothetical protein